MGLTITSRPDRAHPDNTSLISRWVSSRQPIFFDAFRTDMLAYSFNDNGGKLRLIISRSIPESTELAVDDILYVKSYDGSYNTTGKVTAISSTALYLSVDTDIDSVPSMAFVTGYINRLSRENYYVNVVVNLWNEATQQYITSSFRWTPSNDGTGRIYVHAYVNRLIKKLNDFDYSGTNKKDIYSSTHFYLSFTEMWNGNTPTTYNDGGATPIKYYVIDGTKYHLSKYGQNFLDYVPQIESVATKAKFLSSFKRPTMFFGYPFSLGFIYPKELENFDVTQQLSKYGDEGLIGTVNADIDYAQAGFVNHLTISDILTGDPNRLEVWLRVGDIAQRSYFEGGMIEDGYFEKVPPSIGEISPFDVTEKITIDIVDDCHFEEEPIYVRWRNSLGYWDYWLFGNKRFNETQSKSLGTFGKEADEIETSQGSEFTQQMNVGSRYYLVDYVTKEKYQGIMSIYSSSKIEVMVSKNDNLWINAQIVGKTERYRNDAGMVDVSIAIDLPDLITVPN